MSRCEHRYLQCTLYGLPAWVCKRCGTVEPQERGAYSEPASLDDPPA